MSKKLKIGVVGTSWWADAMHLPAIQNHPQAEIAAICGRNAETAQAMGARWSIPQVYTDWQKMLAEADLDAIIVTTGNDTHYPMSMQAMERGLHVLCEKPLALTYREALEMANLAETKGLINLVPFTYSYMPTARYLKQLIAEGYLGKPYHLNMRYYAGYGRDGKYMWRFDLNKSGAGVVGDLGSHFLYLADWFYGEIESVSTLLSHQVPRPATDDNGQPYPVGDDGAIFTLQFANGAQGTIQVTSLAYEPTHFGQIHQMEFHGSDGTLHSYTDWDTIQQVSGAKVGEKAVKELPIPDSIWGNARRDTVHNTYKDVFREQDWMTRQFITGIVEQQPVKPDFADGLRIQRLIEAAQKSHAEKRWVAVTEIN